MWVTWWQGPQLRPQLLRLSSPNTGHRPPAICAGRLNGCSSQSSHMGVHYNQSISSQRALADKHWYSAPDPPVEPAICLSLQLLKQGVLLRNQKHQLSSAVIPKLEPQHGALVENLHKTHYSAFNIALDNNQACWQKQIMLPSIPDTWPARPPQPPWSVAPGSPADQIAHCA